MRKQLDPDSLSQALAEPSRRALLENLRFGHKSVSELVNATQLKQPNVSNHLAKMRQQGIVRAERMGRQVYYSLAMPFADVLLRMHEVAAYPSPADFSTNENNGLTAHEAPDNVAGKTLHVWQEAFFKAVMQGNEDQAVAQVNAMLAQHLELATIYVEVFQACINRIGEMYQQGLTDEAHEHMASAVIERMMARVSQFYAPVVRTARRAILACVPGNWHVIGVRMLSDGLREQGWETVFLGANVPVPSLVAVVKSLTPDLVVLSCSMQDQEPALQASVAELDALRHEREPLTFHLAAGGFWLQQNPAKFRSLPLDFTADSLPAFLTAVHERFSPPVQGKG